MSLFKRKDSPNWWVKLTPRNGRAIQQSTGTPDKVKAREYHDKLKASLWDQERLGIKPNTVHLIILIALPLSIEARRGAWRRRIGNLLILRFMPRTLHRPRLETTRACRISCKTHS